MLFHKTALDIFTLQGPFKDASVKIHWIFKGSLLQKNGFYLKPVMIRKNTIAGFYTEPLRILPERQPMKPSGL